MLIQNHVENQFLYFLNACKDRVNRVLKDVLESSFSNSDELLNIVSYSLLSGGKRLRSALVYAIGEYFQIKDVSILNAAAASLELIHCYSLIHDDLPAMDNDDLRRGKPSCHKAFGEANAILAGDGLQSLAFQVLADPMFNKCNGETKSNMILELAKAVGFLGMVSGQAQDIFYENMIFEKRKEISLANLELLHIRKTGALIKCCIELALLVIFSNGINLDVNIKQQLLNYGQYLGLLFQIQDDILDFEQSTEILGKTSKADHKSHKLTFVTLLGLDGAKQQLEKNYNNIMFVLNNLGNYSGKDIKLLEQFACYFKNRNY